MSRFILILILSTIISFGILSISQNQNVTSATENAVSNYQVTKTRNIANSTIQMLMSKVADDIKWRTSSVNTDDIFDGTVIYTVTDDNLIGEDLIKFYVKANYFGYEREVTVFAKPLDPHPTGITAPAAITANSNILTLGNIIVDGRNHTKTGTLIPGEGTYGVWTTSSFINSGASKIGGTNLSKVDFIPSTTPDPSIIAQNQSWPSGSPPTTPEQVINNLPINISLKEYAKSGDWGSQFANDPDSLNYPLQGVTYVEPNGGEWNPANIEGSGILIVHNDQVNAILKNTSNNFTGLIIADDIIHLQGNNIIGAVISLTQGPSEGNCIGLSNGSILYSKEAMEGALMSIRPRNYGFAANRLLIRHWYE